MLQAEVSPYLTFSVNVVRVACQSRGYANDFVHERLKDMQKRNLCSQGSISETHDARDSRLGFGLPLLLSSGHRRRSLSSLLFEVLPNQLWFQFSIAQKFSLRCCRFAARSLFHEKK